MARAMPVGNSSIGKVVSATASRVAVSVAVSVVVEVVVRESVASSDAVVSVVGSAIIGETEVASRVVAASSPTAKAPKPPARAVLVLDRVELLSIAPMADRSGINERGTAGAKTGRGVPKRPDDTWEMRG